jgi:uncharacterized membrane protein YhhN
MTDLSGGWLSLVVLAGFVLDWVAILLHWVKIKPITKIVAMLLLILWTFSAAGWQAELLVVLLVFAQAFGLAGDVLLLLKERWFLWGLGAFLVGHLFYVSVLVLKFNQIVGVAMNMPGFYWRVVLCVLGWSAVLITFYFIVRKLLGNQRLGRTLWYPIQVYAWILSGMVAFSFLTISISPGFSQLQMLLLVGSVLFLVSDALLTYNRFIHRIKRGQLWVRITYHLAQFCLAWGFLAIIYQ